MDAGKELLAEVCAGSAVDPEALGDAVTIRVRKHARGSRVHVLSSCVERDDPDWGTDGATDDVVVLEVTLGEAVQMERCWCVSAAHIRQRAERGGLTLDYLLTTDAKLAERAITLSKSPNDADIVKAILASEGMLDLAGGAKHLALVARGLVAERILAAASSVEATLDSGLMDVAVDTWVKLMTRLAADETDSQSGHRAALVVVAQLQ